MPKQAIFDKKNVLVTGGAGFIGSHLCDKLVKENKVICVDNFSTGEEKNIDHLLADPNFEFLRHDIIEPLDLESLPELQKFKIQFQGIQEIYNLACPTSPMNFLNNRISTLDTLSLGVKNVLELSRKYKAKFLHFSSSVVYGPRDDGTANINEEFLGKIDLNSERISFDEGNRFAEAMISNYKKVYNMDAKIIRVFRTYGPRMKLNDGQMIPDFVNNAIENKDVVVLGDKEFSSTLCYVTDIVDAALKLMNSNFSGPYNIGSDVRVNITDVANKIISLIGSSSKITYKDKILFMTQLNTPDIAKSRNELGWMPIVVLEKGLKNTIEDLQIKRGHKDAKQALGN